MSAPDVFRLSKGIFYSDVTNLAGGVNVGRLKSAPGGPLDLVFAKTTDSGVTLDLRDRVIRDGQQNGVAMKFGVFTDPHWFAGTFPSTWKDDNGRALPDPLKYRQQASADVLRILRIGDPVVLDFEKCPHAWQLLFLVGAAGNPIAGWVGKGGVWWSGGTNMFRPTAASNEPHQDNPADLYAKAKFAYLPQLYDGAMNNYPAWQEARWEQGDSQNLADSFPVFDAKDYDPQDMIPGTYLFDSNRLAILIS